MPLNCGSNKKAKEKFCILYGDVCVCVCINVLYIYYIYMLYIKNKLETNEDGNTLNQNGKQQGSYKRKVYSDKDLY